MRKIFAQAVISACNTDETFFLTGDLGFMALEDVQEAFGARFINCGIAEQNMVSVAAGLAREGFRVFAYSIAPFIYARPFEQIRNDVGFSHLSVCLVGNGGGYGYGHMGPTHHALEDCAAMAALGLRTLVPAFDTDIPSAVSDWTGPTYLRLGLEVLPDGFTPPSPAPWRELLPGNIGVWVTLGTLAGVAVSVLKNYPLEKRPSLWCCSEFAPPPESFYDAVKGQALTVFEEHVAEGGLGMTLSRHLLLHDVRITRFEHHCALRYPSGLFGSQAFHRNECGLGAESMSKLLEGAR